ncbi:HNH endonuclease [Microbulbifer sp. JMSA002]|uniref:HNH endonuclease n=1 Tax=Microbulbifer sp. JMSA002 TaxID=3243368 RepID=UPI00403907B9
METCIICLNENPITEENPLTDEHIIPEFMGGSLVKKNVCKKCNSKMGTGFEGALANSLFYKLPRFLHGIKGKKRALESPFTGVYDHEEIGRFRVNENGDLTVIPDIKIEPLDDGFTVNISIDKSEFGEAKPHLEKKISRYLKSQGREVDKRKISESIDKLLEEVKPKHNEVDGPEIKGQIEIDIHAQIMLYTKIAFELAVYHFGSEYLDDPVADKLRNMLKTQIPDKTLRGQFPANKADYKQVFDDESHWVVFLNSACYIQLFGLPAIIMYTQENSQYQQEEGIVYKFCYKSQSCQVSTFTKHLSSQNQVSGSI